MSADPVPKVPLVRPELGEAEVEAAARVIRSGWLTQGPEVAAFETELARAVGAEHAVAVSNCTVALELALRVLGVRPGDEVATVSHSFVATANAVLAVGARPVFVDILPGNFGMDPAKLEEAIGPRTKAILCVHQLGIPCELERIVEIGRARGLPVVEDAACAIGSEVLWRGHWERIGRPHGAIACFSFHPRKVVTTGDGGMLTTRDAAIAARLRLLRHHGMSIPDTARHGASAVVFEEYIEPAFNFRLTDLQAAVGRPQLARLDLIVAERRRLARVYEQALESNPALAPPRESPTVRANWQSYPATLRAGADQVSVMQHLLDQGIATKRGVSNSHQEPAYRDRSLWRCAPSGLSVSERARDETILLPIFHGMRTEEQERVVDACARLADLGRKT